MFKFLQRRKEALSGKEICQIYYTLQRYYDGISTNIAVIKNKKKFKQLINTYTDKLNLARGDKRFGDYENKCTFIMRRKRNNIGIYK